MMDYNVALDFKPRKEWLFDTKTRIGLLTEYFLQKLNRGNGY